MSSFRNQIDEDIQEYKEKYPDNANIQKSEWAFNFWVLDKFFNEEEELIFDRIIDYKDRGIDAYEWFEDTKELFLLQNKYYTITRLNSEYVNNNFLMITQPLENGTYSHCPELQKIFTQNKMDDRFTVHLQLYVTNDLTDPAIKNSIKQFNADHEHKYIAEIFYLSDIQEKWYGEAIKTKKELTVKIESVNNGTILNINNEAYKLENGIDAKYVFAPISCIYNMVKQSKEKGYALFEKNIREYLGNRGINKNIYNTLRNRAERKNFFYYNNGVTLICDAISATKQLTSSEKSNPHSSVVFTVKNPQIVNGCQTVNSIYDALEEYDPDDINDQFKDAFVMLKVLQIDPDNPEEQELAKNIVTFNNSQNAIDEKTFVANNETFQRIKSEFEKKGFLLLTKQSDKETYSKKYAKKSDLTKLMGRSVQRRMQFGLESLSKTKDFFIPLDKLLQVVLAFKESGQDAYTMKKDVLKLDTKTYNTVTGFVKSNNVTTDTLLDLYLLFYRSEKEKNKNKDDSACPISFYLIDAFARFECDERDSKQISSQLDTVEKVNNLIKLYKFVTKQYTKKYTKEHSVDYIKMIKMEIDYNLMAEYREMYFEKD